MKKFIVTVSTQLETFNIVGLPKNVLYHPIKAYYSEKETYKFGGKTYSFKRIQDFIIHEFENDNLLNEFLNYVKTNDLKKVSITGTFYIDPELIDEYATNVSIHYLTIDRDEVIGGDETSQKSSEENKEILDGYDILYKTLGIIRNSPTA